MNRKRYLIIIALIIFLFLALFTFASPFNDGEESKKPIEEIEDNAIKEVQKEQEETEQDEEEIVATPEYNSHGVTINKPEKEEIKEEDLSYELALKAVEKVEITLSNSDFEKAYDLVLKVSTEDKKSKLLDRVSVVKEIIDLTDIINTLVDNVNAAKSKEDMNSARNYAVKNDIAKRLNNLSNEIIKELLIDKLETIANLLDDVNVPTINIEGGAILDSNTIIEVEDENKVTIILNGKEIENNYEVSDGVYELVVKDESFNEVKIKFTIDTIAPEIIFDSNPIYVEKDSKVESISLTAKVTDNIDADKTIEPTKIDFISVRNNDELNKLDIDKLDSSKEGTFKVYYETIDNVGNKATAMLEVVVRDTREFKLLSQTSNTQDNYKTMIAVIVTNKEIKEAPAGWSFSLNNPTVITKKYTYNTETTGEEVKLYDLSGNELVVNVVITGVNEFANQNVVLRDHTTLEETINVASGEEKTIDLNGKTLTVDNTNTGTNARLFQNKGKLIFKNGKIVQPLDTTLGVVDNDGGEIILENVTIEDKGSRNASSIRNLNGGKVTIINSRIEADGIAGYITSGSKKDYVYSNSAVYSTGELVIKNSTIKGDPESQYAILIAGGTALVEDTTIDHLRGGFGITAGNVTINNVTVIMPESGRNSSHAIYMEAQADTNVTINGGSFVGTRSSLYIRNNSTTNNLTLNINSGNFDSYTYKDDYKVVNFVKGASTPENKFNINIKGGKFAQTTINGKVLNTIIDDKYIVDGYKQVGADIIPE